MDFTRFVLQGHVFLIVSKSAYTIRMCAFMNGSLLSLHGWHMVLLDRIGMRLKTRKKNTNALRKHAYSNILKSLPPKNEKFQINNSDIFHISAQNIDCG